MALEPSTSFRKLTHEIDELRKEVLKYQPGKASTRAYRVEFPDNLYIGLFGRTGSGKTSLINSLKFAANGKLRRCKWIQVAGQEKAGGHTMFRKLADITKKIYVVDNRGLDEPNTERVITELTAQLDGRRGYSERVEWEGNRIDDNDLDRSKINLSVGHPIGCAVFVLSARHDIDTNTTGLTEVIDFVHQHQGRYPVAVITHVDIAHKSYVDDLKTILQISGVTYIFEVANLTSENKSLEEHFQHSLLSLLNRCMKDLNKTLMFKQQKGQQHNITECERETQMRQELIEHMLEIVRQQDQTADLRIEKQNKTRRDLEAHIGEMVRKIERAVDLERERNQETERERVKRENHMSRELNGQIGDILREREREAYFAIEREKKIERKCIEREDKIKRELKEHIGEMMRQREKTADLEVEGNQESERESAERDNQMRRESNDQISEVVRERKREADLAREREKQTERKRIERENQIGREFDVQISDILREREREANLARERENKIERKCIERVDKMKRELKEHIAEMMRQREQAADLERE